MLLNFVFLAVTAFAAPPATPTDKPVPVPAEAQKPDAPSVMNGWPSVSPDGKWIAFVSDRDDGRDNVFVIGVDGAGERQLSHGGGHLPHWSGDGKEILFAGEDADSGRVTAMAPDADNARPVVNVLGRSPVLSPDGKQVLFLVGSWRATALMAAHVDGSGAIRLAGGHTADGGATTAWNGAWSPDGAQVAYTFGDSRGPLQVHVVNADASGDRALTHMSVDQGSAQMPAWSPDGSRLAFQLNGGRDKPAHIWIIDIATGAARMLNAHTAPYRDEVPAWFPDGKRIAFQSNRTGSMEVWVMNADGSRPHQVTGTPQ